MAPAVADDVQPTSVAPCGNYAVQIVWEDGFNQARFWRFSPVIRF